MCERYGARYSAKGEKIAKYILQKHIGIHGGILFVHIFYINIFRCLFCTNSMLIVVPLTQNPLMLEKPGEKLQSGEIPEIVEIQSYHGIFGNRSASTSIRGAYSNGIGMP